MSVDTETGDVKVDKIWIAHDAGRAINPLLVEGQTEGSVYMGLGEALMEEMAYRHNVHKTPSMLDYKSPTTLETPNIKTVIVETIDPEGPYGAKEAGQGPPTGEAPWRDKELVKLRTLGLVVFVNRALMPQHHHARIDK